MLLSVTLICKSFCLWERSIGLHIKVCVRQLGAVGMATVAKFPSHEIFPSEIIPVYPPPPVEGCRPSTYAPGGGTRSPTLASDLKFGPKKQQHWPLGHVVVVQALHTRPH